MRSANTRRKKWACWNLEEIQHTFEGKSLNEHKRKLLNNAQDQIQKAFDDYEADITDTYENYEVPFEYFCFSNTADLYPNLDFECQTAEILRDVETIDTYGALIDELWHELEVEKEDCVCSVCKMDLIERGKWYFHCRKLIRQRLPNVPWRHLPYRTCPLCRMKIPKDQFDRKADEKNGHFKSTSALIGVICTGVSL